MPKSNRAVTYLCNQCGNTSPKWLGKCPECGEWNSLVEAPAPAAPGSERRSWSGGTAPGVVELQAVRAGAAPRLALPLKEVNRVLGGGIVPGSLTLLGGDPGIGKSTLLLQLAQGMAEQHGRTVYVSGEESPNQIKLRAERLGLSGKEVLLLSETTLDRVLQQLDETRPALAIIDSIQTMYLEGLPSAAGSVGQVRECCLRLMQWAKGTGIPVLIAGHVTKDGAIAGPRVLEHMVDVVLYLEGEGFSPYRVLRGVKNRFGSTNEVGIFEMRELGLTEVVNPSEVFLANRNSEAIGSAIAPVLEGSRPLLVEIQALVTPSMAPAPRRVANGIDFNRLLLIAAVLSKHLGLPLGGQDILINVVGGLRVEEPAADAAVALAIASSFRELPVKPGYVAIGEVGLSGELRPVSQTGRRLAEAASIGFKACLLPVGEKEATGTSLELIRVESLREMIRLGLQARPQERPD